MEVGIDG